MNEEGERERRRERKKEMEGREKGRRSIIHSCYDVEGDGGRESG
jgi:hypothetical protein